MENLQKIPRLRTKFSKRAFSFCGAAHTHPFNSLFSGTTRVSWYQKGKTNLDFTEARDSEWQWHQLAHMQVCTLLQTDNHANTPPLSFYRPDALPVAQPTASKHCGAAVRNKLTCNIRTSLSIDTYNEAAKRAVVRVLFVVSYLNIHVTA